MLPFSSPFVVLPFLLSLPVAPFVNPYISLSAFLLSTFLYLYYPYPEDIICVKKKSFVVQVQRSLLAGSFMINLSVRGEREKEEE